MKGPFRSLYFLGLGLVASLSSCSAPPVNNKASSPGPARPLSQLHKGQTSAQVETLLGKPAEIRPFSVKDGDLQSEVWIYRVIVEEKEWQVPTGVREIPAVNPRTGQAIVIQEPIYETQQVRTTDIVELLMVEQQLLEWKTRRETTQALQQR
jgi:hypothetical protein